MKYSLILLTLFTTNFYAQNLLQFDKRNIQCEDKWIAYQMDKDSTYTFGFIYIDSKAGLTFNYEGKFKIEKNGVFNKLKSEVEKEVGFIKTRLQPNRIAIAEIPEAKFKELHIEKTPNWLKAYKTDENSVDRLYRWGYMYNSWNEFEKALTYLKKADKINSKFKGLQTELGFSYNALGKFDDAEFTLKKAINENPEDCYALKELAYTYTRLVNFEKVAETYLIMTKSCTEQTFIQETAHNLAYEYFKIKDTINFIKWKTEAEKWSKSENQYTKNLNNMQAELEK
ncbi:tetratricopeptide repeat protein [Flavobacterium sp.]|jgi:tetratricopeptide (TPR) repeat protein|uniref:tetratricopeptide repeat protein n=1 Tax=Flavobacterium sp. TaxID=239 RepID=UPI0037C17943